MFHRTSEIIDFLYTRTALSLCILSLHGGGSKSIPSICYLLNSCIITLPFKITVKSGRERTAYLDTALMAAHCLSSLWLCKPLQAAHHDLPSRPYNMHCAKPPSDANRAGLHVFPTYTMLQCKDKVLCMIPGYEQSLWLWNLNLYETQRHTHCSHRKLLRKPSRYTYIC